MGKSNFAVFVDLENAGAKESMLRSIIEKVKIRGDILLGKVYGYTDRYSDLKECLLSNTFFVVPSLRYGKNQKNNLDIQLVIDAMEVAYTNQLIDSFCIVSGDSDYTPLVGKLKTMGKDGAGHFALGGRVEHLHQRLQRVCVPRVGRREEAAKAQARRARGRRRSQRADRAGRDDRRRSGRGADVRQRAEGHAHPPAAGLQRAQLRLFDVRQADLADLLEVRKSCTRGRRTSR